MTNVPTENNDPRDTEEKDLADELEMPDSGIPIPDIEDPFMANIVETLVQRRVIAANRTPVNKVWLTFDYETKKGWDIKEGDIKPVLNH